MSEQSSNEKKVGHVYQITYDLGNGRQFSVNGNFAEGSSEDQMYQSATKVMNVAERIRSRGEIELLQRELKVREKALNRQKEALRHIQSKAKRTPSDENQITSYSAQIEKILEDIEEGQKNLDEAMSRANGKELSIGSATVQ